ncbi:hypothetical protein [Succinimonas amylolytica]|uniref:hypothetical protein n=1 Tax=Succinimonas amylolytica TaxID=83769 RepID=UPI0023A8ED27
MFTKEICPDNYTPLRLFTVTGDEILFPGRRGVLNENSRYGFSADTGVKTLFRAFQEAFDSGNSLIAGIILQFRL